MKYNVQFQEITKQVNVNFGEVNNISDGGYERGLEEGQKKGYKTGYTEGEEKGYTEGYSKGETNGYNNGYSDGEKDGHSSGYDKGLIDGNTFYDAFWDDYQQNGKRTAYENGFCYFSDESFKPKYDIILGASSNAYLFSNSKITNLKAILEEQGVILDTSKATNLWYIVRGSTVTHLPTIDCSNCNMVYLFSKNANLEYVEKIILPPQKNQTTGVEFAYSLKHIIAEGKLYCTLKMVNCPLDLESALSFINALENYMGTEKEYSYNITFSPTTWNNLEQDGLDNYGDKDYWRKVINDLGWNAS